MLAARLTDKALAEHDVGVRQGRREAMSRGQEQSAEGESGEQAFTALSQVGSLACCGVAHVIIGREHGSAVPHPWHGVPAQYGHALPIADRGD